MVVYILRYYISVKLLQFALKKLLHFAGLTKLEGNVRLTLWVPRNLSLIQWIPFERDGFKIRKFYKECMSSLTLLPEMLQLLKVNFSWNIAPKEPKNSKSLVKFTKLFNCLLCMGYFQVASCLCIKTSLSAKPFIWKWVPHTGLFSFKSNSF